MAPAIIRSWHLFYCFVYCGIQGDYLLITPCSLQDRWRGGKKRKKSKLCFISVLPVCAQTSISFLVVVPDVTEVWESSADGIWICKTRVDTTPHRLYLHEWPQNIQVLYLYLYWFSFSSMDLMVRKENLLSLERSHSQIHPTRSRSSLRTT